MKKFAQIIGTGVLACLTQAAGAAIAWDWQYEANATPTTGGSIEIGGSPATTFTTFIASPVSESASGGLYTFSSLGSNDAAAFVTNYINDPPTFGLNSDTGYTMEYRARLDQADTLSQTSHIVEVDEARSGVDRYWALALMRDGSQNSVRLFNFEGSNVDVNVAPGLNTYRVTVLGTTATLYINDSTIPAGNIPTGTFALDAIRFGDLTGGADAEATVDYMRFFDGGAVAPVPEPASLSLIGIGCAALLVRRR